MRHKALAPQTKNVSLKMSKLGYIIVRWCQDLLLIIELHKDNGRSLNLSAHRTSAALYEPDVPGDAENEASRVDELGECCGAGDEGGKSSAEAARESESHSRSTLIFATTRRTMHVATMARPMRDMTYFLLVLVKCRDTGDLCYGIYR